MTDSVKMEKFVESCNFTETVTSIFIQKLLKNFKEKDLISSLKNLVSNRRN